MKNTSSHGEAQKIAIDALAFIAAQPDLLARFLGLSGIAASDIRQAAAEAGFFAGVLSFLCANEVDLLEFCRHSNHLPETVVAALKYLPGGSQEESL